MRKPNGFWRSVAYLWGIETCQCRAPLICLQCVCSLPMRDWNWGAQTLSASRNLVCSLPMRDWNLQDARPWSVLLQSVAYLWGIETKFLSCISGKATYWSVAYLWGIETRWALLLQVRGTRVCSLPMRDWNENGRICPICRLRSVAYLWGIETRGT